MLDDTQISAVVEMAKTCANASWTPSAASKEAPLMVSTDASTYGDWAYILSREKKNYRGIFQVTHKDIFKAEMTPGVWGYSLTHAAKISRNLVWVTENFAAAKAMARGHSSTKAMAFESATQAKASLAASLRDATLRFRTAVLCPVDCCPYGSGPLRDHLPARHPQWQQQAARCLPLLTELPGGSCVIVSVYQCISVIVSHNIHISSAEFLATLPTYIAEAIPTSLHKTQKLYLTLRGGGVFLGDTRTRASETQKN